MKKLGVFVIVFVCLLGVFTIPAAAQGPIRFWDPCPKAGVTSPGYECRMSVSGKLRWLFPKETTPAATGSSGGSISSVISKETVVGIVLGIIFVLIIFGKPIFWVLGWVFAIFRWIGTSHDIHKMEQPTPLGKEWHEYGEPASNLWGLFNGGFDSKPPQGGPKPIGVSAGQWSQLFGWLIGAGIVGTIIGAIVFR